MKENVEKVRNGAMKIGQAMYANQGQQQSSEQEQSQSGQGEQGQEQNK